MTARPLRFQWHTALFDPEIGLSMVARVVGGALIEYASRDGVAWPSLPELGERAGVRSERTLQKGLRQLERAGLLVVERRTGLVNRYQLTLPDPRTDYRGSDEARPASRTGLPPHEPPHEPPREMQVGTREPVNQYDLRSRASAQTLVAWFVDHARELGAEPPRRVVGQVAQQLGALTDEGYDEQTLQGALALMLERRLHPSTLSTLIIEAQAGPAAPRRAEAEHPVDRRFREAYGTDASRLLSPRPNENGKIDDGVSARE